MMRDDRLITKVLSARPLDALEFKAARNNDPTLSAIELLRELNRSAGATCQPMHQCRSVRSGGGW
jgi:hypothetical protein